MRILVVEDEKILNRLISEGIEDEGYNVDSCFNGSDALDYISSAEYDAIVMDILMSKMSGLEVVRKIRSDGNTTPVIFLTSLSEVNDRVEGLNSGGDYYLVKPFYMDELVAVVRVLARKSSGQHTNELTVGDLTLDMSTQTVTRGGRMLSLSPKEYALLEYMMRNRGIVLSREMIENNLWNFDYEGGTNVVDVYISFLRKKIDTGFDKKLIHTVWGTGWIFKDGD